MRWIKLKRLNWQQFDYDNLKKKAWGKRLNNDNNKIEKK